MHLNHVGEGGGLGDDVGVFDVPRQLAKRDAACVPSDHVSGFRFWGLSDTMYLSIMFGK